MNLFGNTNSTYTPIVKSNKQSIFSNSSPNSRYNSNNSQAKNPSNQIPSNSSNLFQYNSNPSNNSQQNQSNNSNNFFHKGQQVLIGIIILI
jgi:hypothetical protein